MRCGIVRRLALASIGLGVWAAPGAASAQAVLDRGSFRLTMAGQEVGTESFSIRQDGTGPSAITIAQATVSLDTGKVTQELTSWLRISPAGARAAEYRLRIQGSSHEQITGTVAGGRFSARIVSPAGEMMREYLASDRAVVIDDGLAHQYYFLAQRAGSGPALIPVLIPRESRQVVATVSPGGQDALEIGGRRVDARRLLISAGGQADRELWVDADNRVLRLSIPARGFVATRTSM